MKAYVYIFYLISLFCLLSCRDDSDALNPPFIDIDLEDKIVNVPNNGASLDIRINTNVNDLRVVPLLSEGYTWCNTFLGITSNIHLLTINVTPNEGTKVRKSEWIVSGTAVSNDTIHVVQLGTEPNILTSVNSKNLTNVAQKFTIDITSNIEYKQKMSSDWLTLEDQSSLEEMTTTSFTYSVTKNSSFSVRRDTIVLSPVDESLPLIVKIPIEQEPADIEEVLGKDEKVIIKEAKNISGYYYQGCDVDKTIDGDYGTYFGSGTNVKDPVIIEYILDDNIEKVDYVKLYQRTNVSSNNQLTKGIIEYKTESSDNWIQCGSFNETEIVHPLRVDLVNVVNPKSLRMTLQRTQNGLVAFGEFECYKYSKENIFDLENDAQYFEDDVFSKLKSTTSLDDLNKITHPMVRSIAQELLNNTYPCEFRSRRYYSCKNPEIVGNELTCGKRSICDNPTGIYFEKGKKYIVFVGKDLNNNDLNLFIKDWSMENNDEEQTISLKSGLNIIESKVSGNGYVQYWTDSDIEEPKSVDIHICYGTEIGFWDIRAGHNNDDWMEILSKSINNANVEKIPSVMLDVCGEKVQLINKLEAFNTYCRYDIESVLKEYDKMLSIQYSLMGLYEDAQPKNRMLGVRSWGGNPNWNGVSANFPNSEETMLNVNAFKNNIWLFGHEFGHGNQVKQMKGAGWTEVTNNIYSQHCMYFMNNKRCRLEHYAFNRDGYDNEIIGDLFNAYLNDALIKKCIYFTHNATMDKNVYTIQPFVTLAPLWQLSLFFMITEDAQWSKPHFWGDVITAAIENQEGTSYENHGQRYVDFMKRSMKAADMNLTVFFEKIGLLKEMNIEVYDYGLANIVITKEMVEDVKEYGMNFKNIPTSEMNYISGNTVDIYRRQLPMTGTYNYGVTDGVLSKTISHAVWKNVVAYETYNAKGEMIEVCIAGTGSRDNSSTYVRFPDGATGIKAVSWDGKREWVYGE